jgi:hypothetical protein
MSALAIRDDFGSEELRPAGAAGAGRSRQRLSPDSVIMIDRNP